jgi:hypothetical protein
VNGDNDLMSKSVQRDTNAGNAEVPESDDAKDFSNHNVDANEAEANKANVTKDAIDSATKPIEANEANKSHAHQDSNKKSTCYDENFDKDSTRIEPKCGGDLISYYRPISVSGDPQGLREATVLAVDPDHACLLTSSTYNYLPKCFKICHISKFQKSNKLVNIWEYDIHLNCSS